MPVKLHELLAVDTNLAQRAAKAQRDVLVSFDKISG
jgi:hypothetical protein